MHTLFYIGLMIAFGIGTAKVVSYIKLPDITGYLIAGLIIGPSILGLVPHEAVHNLTLISEAALGFIAYSIGSEFNLKSIKSVGKQVFVITIFQAVGAILLVDLAMIFIFKQEVYFSIVLGAIATATAPGPILMIIKQYKAKGPVVDTLLPLVALDDALGIMIFGICLTFATTLAKAGTQLSIINMLLQPIKEIGLSIIIGCALGFVLAHILNRIKDGFEMVNILVAIVLLGVGLSYKFHASPILLSMTIGATVSNLVSTTKGLKAIHSVEKFTPPLYVAFFTLAGVELNLSMLSGVGYIGLGYIIFRMIGKIYGSNLGAKVCKAPKTVQRYLGVTLVPQAGVAIGLALVAQSVLPHPYGTRVKTIVLAATVVYELIGPLMAKIALTKAGEIDTNNDSNITTMSM